MEKNLFSKEYEKIEVPKEDVVRAIKMGVRQANLAKNPRKKRVFVFSAAAAAAIFISSGFIFPSISKVMAEMPLVGWFYKDLIGEQLASQKLITQLNETASYKGIDVAITSAYFDGAVIGVTFDVKGNVKADEDGGLAAFYEIFNGDNRIEETKEIVHMERVENGFTGHIQLSYPKSALPTDTTFPLEFKSIGQKKGSWRFNVPIKQLPFETVKMHKVSSKDDVKFQVNSVIYGKASTALNYIASYPSEGKLDQIRMELFDDKGNPIHPVSTSTLEKKMTGDKMIVIGRTNILQPLQGKTGFVEIRPQAAISESNQYVSLDTNTPVLIKAERQNLSVMVEDITVKEKSVTVDFQLNRGEKGNWNFTYFHDFARNDVTLVKVSRKELYEKPIKHTIKTLDKEKLRFRSTFDSSTLGNFQPDRFVVRVNLNSMAMNMPLELAPVKIEID
ncbi:DUF4179 domain-containing protein [Bacillus sp. sid0103]|uniref:DUF4179 domain-containing protein n=1 Tax=Bacillus sp. sid0103 TaxID=2856337 RepID=UPI001C449EE4|nr:DUF4179 domain-containing protein [Bacillus sp. sid0103]MBV7506636.1 DUF4179 domain-containing protein [Bacillus sp. sid0103]